MKIAFYGNTCNNFYAIARALRRHSKIDAHLFLDSDADALQLPESESPELKGNYPDWIHLKNYRPLSARVLPSISPLIEELLDFDIVMVSGGGVRLTPFLKKPFIFYVTGWDLTVAPFPFTFFSRPKGLPNKLSAIIGGYWQRKGIRGADEIWTQPFFPFSNALQKLKISDDQIVNKYFPIMVDTELFKDNPRARSSSNPQVQELLRDFDFILFHPSRMMLKDDKKMKATGQWKGNDKLFLALAEFIKKNPKARPVLAMIEREGSPDLSRAKKLIENLQMEKSVRWLKPPRPSGFQRSELLEFYSIADVVADEFGIGWFGSVVVEGLSTSKPVLCHVDEQVMKQLYPWHPILSGSSPDEISAHLHELYKSATYRQELGERGRKWAVEFHSIENVSKLYVEQIRELGTRMGLSV